MVKEDRIIVTDYALYEQDRDPENGMFGGNRIVINCGGIGDRIHYRIMKFNVELRTLQVRNLLDDDGCNTLQLQSDTVSSVTLFEEEIVSKWNRLKHNFIHDENYTDYLPGFYESIESMAQGKLIILKDDDPPLLEKLKQLKLKHD